MSALPIAFRGITRVGQRVFMPVAFADWDTNTAFPEVVVVVFRTSDASVELILRDTRCGVPASVIPPGNVGPDGTYYVLGDGWYGSWIHGGKPSSGPSCALRVPMGANAFDPAWKQVLDGVIPGFGDMSTLLVHGPTNLVYTDLMKQPPQPFASFDDLWAWQTVAGNKRRVACSASTWSDCKFVDTGFDGSLHWFSTIVDDRVLMTSLRSADQSTAQFGNCSVYDMTPTGPKRLFETTGFISNIVRVR
jgi:hypothetical protein